MTTDLPKPATNASQPPGNQPLNRREAILRAAEMVFARDGFSGATMREISRSAGTTVALTVYHYETKLSLYCAVFESRQHINDQRIERLNQIDLAAPDAVEQVVAAFVEPILALHDNPDDIWFARLLLRESADPSSQDRPSLSYSFDPLTETMMDCLRTIKPGRADDFYPWLYMFSVGALSQSSYDTRVANLANGNMTTEKSELLKNYLTAALRYS